MKVVEVHHLETGNSGRGSSAFRLLWYINCSSGWNVYLCSDQSAADDLDASDTVTDVFTYTVSDGTATDTATLTITITGVNDAPVAVADTDTVQLTDTVTNSTNGPVL